MTLGDDVAALPPAIRRLDALFPLEPETATALLRAAAESRPLARGRELIGEGRSIDGSVLILEGWAARMRELADGRRQIVNFVLPGDFVGVCHHLQPLASSTIVAITPLRVCDVPDRDDHPDLAHAAAISGALDEAHLIGQITRLGRLSAHERIIDLLLEFHERLDLAGLVEDGAYRLPITQEMLADALGLTPVHINRTLQRARKSHELDWREKSVVLHDPAALRRKVGRNPVRVTEAQLTW